MMGFAALNPSYILPAMDLEKLHDGCFRNRSSLGKAANCGCFYCCKEFRFAEIAEWVDGGETALCPYCGIDAVLPFNTPAADPELLRAMHARWFE